MSALGATVKCGNCGNLMAVGDTNSPVVRCPHCQQVVQVPPPAVPPEAGPSADVNAPAGGSEPRAPAPDEHPDLTVESLPGWLEPKPAPDIELTTEPRQAAPLSTLDQALPPTPPPAPNPWEGAVLVPPAAESTPPAPPEPAPAPPRVLRPPAKLGLAVWLLALLIPYAAGTTAATVLLYRRGVDKPIHPLLSLPDQGLDEELQPGRKKEIIAPTESLPADLVPVKLGETRRVGDLDVTPVSVTREQLVYTFRTNGPVEPGDEVLVLRLRITSRGQLVFPPSDPTFNRRFSPSAPSYTHLQIGERRFYGVVRDAFAERVKGQNFGELLPGDTLETAILAGPDSANAGNDQAVAALAAATPTEQLIWRVHLRKGREEVATNGDKKRPWVTTVLPVAFTPADVRDGTPAAAPEKPEGP